MADASLALQGAIMMVVKASCPLISGRFFDRVPADAVYPLAEVGAFQTVDDSADCMDGMEIYTTLHIWSRAVGQVEAKRVASEVRSCLHNATLDLGSDWQFVLIEHQSTNVLKDPDGITTHAVMTFRALVDAR